jgi:hypothetical protein
MELSAGSSKEKNAGRPGNAVTIPIGMTTPGHARNMRAGQADEADNASEADTAARRLTRSSATSRSRVTSAR